MLSDAGITVSLPFTFVLEMHTSLLGWKAVPQGKKLLMEKSCFMEKFPSSLPATAQNYLNNLSFHIIPLKSLSGAHYHAEL